MNIVVGCGALESNHLPLQPSCPISIAPQLPLRRHVMVGDTQNAMTTSVGLVKKPGKNPSHASPETTSFARVSVSFWGHATASLLEP